MLLADFGTSYCKILATENDEAPRIVATRELDRDFFADLATGHNAARRSRRSINELTALARGGRRLVGKPDFVLLDCGSRRQSDIATTGNQNIQHHQNPFMHPGTCARNL